MATNKTTFRFTLPNGSIVTRKSTRPYTHIVLCRYTQADKNRNIVVQEKALAKCRNSSDRKSAQTYLDGLRAANIPTGTDGWRVAGWSQSAINAEKTATKARKYDGEVIVHPIGQ